MSSTPMTASGSAGNATTTTTTTPPVKLRDSCHACASSKLRCTKEKPTCSRCAKRGRTCQYFATRRAGRKQAPKNDPDHPPASVKSSSHPSPSRKRDRDAAAAASTGSIQVMLDQYDPANYADSNPDLVPHTGTASPTMAAEPTPEELMMNFDDYFPSPMDVSIVDGTDTSTNHCPEYYFGTWGQNCLLDPTNTWTRVLEKTDFNIDLGALYPSPEMDHMSSAGNPQQMPSTMPAAQQPQPQQQQQRRNTQPKPSLGDSPCACLPQTLGLVSQLFQTPNTSPPSSPMCRSSGSSVSSNDRMTSSGPGSASSFADGERAIETISSLLQCSCQQDSYLLALMSLAVFKAVSRYEEAARQSTESADSHSRQSSVSSHHTDEDSRAGGHPRMAAQTVLGKLHRVQGLVNTMSQRLKASKAAEATIDGRENPVARERRATIGCGGAVDMTVPFSATLLDQLEEDLRKRVRAVSSQVVNTLRQY